MPDAGSWCIEAVHGSEAFGGPNVGGGLPPTAECQSTEVRPRSWTPIQFLGRFHEQVHHAVQAICHHRFP